MGTSSNHRSRTIPTWRPARALLGVPDVQALHQSRELWRAAIGDQDANLRARLQSESVNFASRLAATENSPISGADSFEEHLQHKREASIFDSITRRALQRAIAQGGGSKVFGSELFAEAVGYFASRDLPSYVGAKGRLKDVGDAIKLKTDLQSHARKVALAAELKSTKPSDWRAYVAHVLAVLKKGQG